MNFFQSAYNLLFDQRIFFAEKREGLLIPAVLTVVYAVAASLFAIQLLSTLDVALPAGTGGLVAGVTVVSTAVSILISWFFVAALFFGCLKFIGYAECSYSQVLSVCGYVSVILLIGQVLTGIVSFIGAANTLAALIFSGVFLLWSVPVWYFGFKSFCDIPEKKLKTAVAVPVLVMVILSVITNIGTIFAM